MIIAYKAVDTYRWKSIFAAEKADVLWRLQDYQHNVRDINIDLVLPDTLKIIIDSYKWIFNTTINDKTFLITENGTLIPSVYSTDLKELVVINNFDKNKYIDYKKTFDTEYIEKIYKIIELLEENIINLEISDLEYYLVEREIHITVDEYTIIIFDLDWEFKEQIEKIAIFNKDYLDINNKTIIYIDLRIKNKVFYCTSENEFQCMENLKSVYWLE
jgi:cell division septal protein FtsQ